ncbi:hypothetical protein [Pseudomonas sp. 273]|uniref:hypothetical protein n=1 Tax=Pseudomonas sp. 273 TaxID=75692 RepID=UPI0023D7DB85|nr:hypothetical protein [Pseudomonas sp. 273]
MPSWMISYHKDDNTSTLSMPCEHAPSLEEAERYLLEWARHNLEAGDYGAAHDATDGKPGALLLQLYGITISGITRE